MRVSSWATSQDQASALRLDPPFILDLPPQTGPPHQIDPTFILGLLPQIGSCTFTEGFSPLNGPPPSDWVLYLRLDSTFVLGLLPQTGPPPEVGSPSQTGLRGGTRPPPSAQASPDCRMTVTDTYNDFPTRASFSEGCTPPSRTSRLSTASAVPSTIWGRK